MDCFGRDDDDDGRDDAVKTLKELKRLRAFSETQQAALAEKDDALAEMEAALAQKDIVLMQKVDELDELRREVQLQKEQAQDFEICVTINSASDLKEVHAKLAEKIQEAAELSGKLKFMIKLMRVDEPSTASLSTTCTEAVQEPTAVISECKPPEEHDDPNEVLTPLTEEELSKVRNLMHRYSEDPQTCLSTLKHYAWHAGRAGQHLKRKQTGVEETGGIAGMSVSDLVNNSIKSEDLQFASSFPAVRSELLALKSHLKTAGSPVEVLEVSKYIAQGTAGWVFIAKRKSTGQRHALKVIRMTQVSTGLREWCVSKLMRKFGIANTVLTDEDVYVLPKKNAPKVFEKHLEFAGPVPYYACFIQEFIEGGTLEDFSQQGKLTPALLLKALANVSETLAAMHKSKVQHRDVKPANVLLQMKEGELVAAKLIDFGNAELGDNPQGKADDVRRFGVTVFAVATGELWTASQLIRAKHEDLVNRITVAAADFPDGPMKRLPEAVHELLEDSPSMASVAKLMAELSRSL